MKGQEYGKKAIILTSLCIFVQRFEAISNKSQLLPIKQKHLNGGTLEEVTFYAHYNADKLKAIARKGILYKHPQAKATVLVCHGFMCNKFDVGFLRRLLFENYNVFTFDFRAHGECIDPEQCCTFGRDEAFDVLGAVEYLNSRTDVAQLPLFAYGFSMGAVAAIQAAAYVAKKDSKQIFAGLILDCPYDTSQNVIKRALENLKITVFGHTFDLPGKSFLERYAFNPWVQWLLKTALKTIAYIDATATNTYIYPLNPAQSIKLVNAPIFFIHCYNDEKITEKGARALFANAPNYKRLWITRGRHHFDSIVSETDKYAFKVRRFIETVLNGTFARKVNQEKIISDMNKKKGVTNEI